MFQISWNDFKDLDIFKDSADSADYDAKSDDLIMFNVDNNDVKRVERIFKTVISDEIN